MQITLLLPFCSELPPESSREIYYLQLTEQQLYDVAQIQAKLVECPQNIQRIHGSERTPVLVWLLAKLHFSKALCFYFNDEDKVGQVLPEAETSLFKQGAVTLPHTQLFEQSLAKNTSPARRQSSVSATGQANFPRQQSSAKSNNELFHIYLRFAWGASEDVALQREALRYIERAQQRGLYVEAEDAKKNGIHAYKQGQHLSKLLDTEGEAIAQAWLRKVSSSQNKRVLTHLEKILKSWQKRQAQLKERSANRNYVSGLTPLKFSEHHPNSLRHMEPSESWTVYIDESGRDFDESAQEYALNNPKVGKVVALVVPSRTQLTNLQPGFHANELTSKQVDETLGYLLRQDVGVFGFSVQDPGAFAGNWFSHIVLLARWVLLQLPIIAQHVTRVNFYIERNDGRLAYQNITSLASLLEGELQAIDNERFAKLRLSMELMDKKHPHNGYVDTLAFTWGSSASESKDRLKKSALMGHCFLHPNQQAMERLYLAISRNGELAPSDWFALCTAAIEEPRKGVLSHYLQRLGEQILNNTAQWLSYLEEVRQQLRSKNYRLSSIGQALDWLETFTPRGEALPAIYRLSLETARLAQENHLGKVNLNRLQICLELIKQLEDEDAQEACSALLRVAVNGTNNFEFKVLQPTVEKWLKKPIALAGLANYAKLHSSLGQMLAFTGELDLAIEQFDHAIALFGRLSDKQQAQREQMQTQAYRLICLMDQGEVAPAQIMLELSGTQNLLKYSRTLASSGQNLRYTQHLWLRALLVFPKQTQEARDAYLEQAHQWQYGEDHPWGLIAAYRGWLLHLTGQSLDASQHFSNAIALCDDAETGPVLWWMAEVLRTLAQTLGVTPVEQPSRQMREYLQVVLVAAPHQALENFAQADQCSHEQIMQHLQLCLPFNFH
ncbi:MAG: hypothetical protein GXZ10_02380 [Gammaproteobacteria bacterium]|nr:hypothetical protein [Gammaproteobacteria bacterium]